ncbi:MAG: hypothetical protein V4687_04595 [Bacteroidota bacterium]
MELLNLAAPERRSYEILKPVLLLVILILAYPIVQYLVIKNDPTAGYVDPSILVLAVMGLALFLVMIGLCAWLFSKVTSFYGLPAVGILVSQFKTLSVCHQLGFYLASFSLLLFAGVMCVMAIL